MVTSISAISANEAEIEKAKEFCIYTHNDMIKMIDPYYIDDNDNKVYFDNIEEYARYIGPDWFGVSYCGKNIVVNNIGEYFTVSENTNYEKREINEDTNEEELKKYKLENELNLYRSRSLEEYKAKIKSYYDEFIFGKGLKSIPLSSEHNPAYNPYHPALIKIEGIKPDDINFITTMGIPYEADKSLYEDLIKKNETKIDFCVSLSQKGSTITCAIAYTDEIQDTISISNSEGKSYHKSVGTIHSVGDTITDEINRSIELAVALSISNSTNANTSKGFSKSFERVHNVINTTSNSTTDNTDDTITKSKENAYTHMVSEDHSHAVTNSEDIADETNWSKSKETSHVEEYTRMNKEDYDKYKDVKYIPDVPPADERLGFERALDNIMENKIVKKILGSDRTPEQERVYDQYKVNNPFKYNKRSVKEELPVHKYEHDKRDFLGVVEGTVGAANVGVGLLGTYFQDEANVIQRQAIRSQEQMAVDQANLQIQLGLAGQRTNGKTTTNGSTKGGSKTKTTGWSDCNTDSSGINKGWTNTTGYSDAHTTGHAETSSIENSVADSTSRMLTSNFNNETGWVNEESKTNTTTNGYSYGRSNQISINDQDTYDEAIETSSQNSYDFSQSISKGETKSANIQVTLTEDGPQKIVAFPIYTTEVTIWATGYTTEDGKIKIKYNKSLVPVKFEGFTHTLEYYDKKITYDDGLVNRDVSKFTFHKEDGKKPNTLTSDKYLAPGNYITTDSGEHSFGLLPTGELVLCRGSYIKEGCDRLWSNRITTLDDDVDHDLKFFIGYNGHLYITAKNIYKDNIRNVKYSDELINKLDNYANTVNENYILTPFKTELQNKLKDLSKSSHEDTETTLNMNKRAKIPDDDDDDDDEVEVVNTKTKSTTITTTKTKTTKSTSTTTSTKKSEATSNQPKTGKFVLTDKDYIIWDSLPKDLPFNVGFPDDKGYYLYINDYKADTRIGATVSLYDGVGVKIWEIRGYQKNYNGYAFPVEYVYPLSIDTTLDINENENEKYYDYDKHNALNPNIIKDLDTNTIEMNCETILNQNEALVSKNKQYRFYIQNTGNMVIKDHTRTTWSSMTANIELFEGPYHIALSPIGEFILRDTHNYSVWHSTNPIVYNNISEILKKYKFSLTLSDEGELYVEDQNHNVYWSNWDKRLFSSHMRFINPVLYEISSCKEHVRGKEIYNIFAKPNNYEYYLVPNDPSTFVRKYYFNNLLPGESLQSNYNAGLNITDTEAVFYYNIISNKENDENNSNKNDTKDTITVTKVLASCAKNKGVKQLRLNNNGLYLDCQSGSKTITKFNLEYASSYSDKIKNNTLYDHDAFYSDYNRLSIEYKSNMDHPNLMIFNVLTWEPIWGLDPSVKYLNKIYEVNENDDIPMLNGRIIEYNKFNIYDKLISNDNTDKFIYISNKFGLELENSLLINIHSMEMKNNNFYINDKLIIKNHDKMTLKYKGEYDKIEVTDKNGHVWDLNGDLTECEYIISNDKKCNTFYTLNPVNVTSISPTINKPNGFINFYNNILHFVEYNKFGEDVKFNITEYTNIEDPIFSLSLTNEGNIELNNGQYTLHKEYYKPDEYYFLYVRDKNLILRSSTGEYKWAVNKNINGRDYDADVVHIGDSFTEGEMIYCGDYSVILLDGKLIYRNHETLESNEIIFNSKVSSEKISEIVVYDDSFIIYNGKGRRIYGKNAFDEEPNENSMLRCENSNHGIVWDIGNGKPLWSYPEIIETETSTTTTIDTTSTTSTTSTTTTTTTTITTTTTTTTTPPPPITSYSTSYITNYSTEYSTKTETSLVTKTTTTKETYAYIGYTGNLGSKNYLGVNELKEYTTLMARYGGSSKSPSKYIRWLVKSKDDPSVMYLANNNGGFSDYCLSIGEAKDSSSYYLTITKCSNTSYLFKYNVPFTEPSGKRITDSPNIGVYNNDGTLFTNKNGAPYCIHYSDTLYISQCRYIEGYPNFKWNKISQKTEYYTQTSTKTNVQTSTSYITSSTVIPNVTSTVLTMVITPTPTPNEE